MKPRTTKEKKKKKKFSSPAALKQLRLGATTDESRNSILTQRDKFSRMIPKKKRRKKKWCSVKE